MIKQSQQQEDHTNVLIEATNVIEDLLEFHPEVLSTLSAEDQALLSKFFFAGRAVDVEDVADYQRELERKEPGITTKVRAAYVCFQRAAKMDIS